MELGMKGVVSALVTKETTAAAVGSGGLLVFGTPFMIAMMEKAACECIKSHLEEGQSSVGTMLNVAHTSATPVGMEVRAEATLTAVDGRKLSFEVVAYDEKGEIGKGTHERFIIHEEKFLAKTYDKL